MHGSSGLGEAYRLGWFRTDDLTALLRLLARSYRRFEPIRRRGQRATAPVLDPIRRRHRPDRGRDRSNIGAHYDLGNAFFELFLDETLTYSSGWFASPDATLAEASLAKIDRLCRVLDLRPGQRVVEIGTGWGSFAVHAAANYGVEVVTTTLSAEQHRVATQRVAAAGLSDRVEVRFDHYRDLDGVFDACVAVEMIEAVDWRELDDFVAHIARLVLPSGAVGLQAIVTAPGRHALARAMPTTSSSPTCSRAARSRRCPPSWTRRPVAPTWFRSTSATSACTTPRRCVVGGSTSLSGSMTPVRWIWMTRSCASGVLPRGLRGRVRGACR